MWLCALAPERLSYPSCPPLLWLLNQMVPSFLAVPGHLAPQPTTVWDPEPCRRFITLIESTQTQPLLTSPSALFTPSTLHASPFTLSQFSLSLCQTLPFHFYCGLLFINAAFPLSLLHGPLFLVGRVHRESKNTSSCVFLFFVVLKGEKSVSTSVCNSQFAKAESFCLCHTNTRSCLIKTSPPFY